MVEFYNPDWLLVWRLSILQISHGAFTCFAAMVCNDLGRRGVVVLKARWLNLGYRKWKVRQWPVQRAFLSTAGIVVDNYSGYLTAR